jgi:hypothetical protein
MKILSKLVAIALTTLALFFSAYVKAQTTAAHAFVLSLGIEPGLPTGSARIGTTFTLGGDIRLQYGLSDRFAVAFTTGGYHFFPKRMPGTEGRYGSYGVGPIKAGIKEFFAPNLYFGAEAGVGYEVTEKGFGNGQHKLILSPALGYANKHWDVGVYYESYSGQQNNYGQVALRIGYGFQL